MTITEIKALVHDLVDTNASTYLDARMVRAINRAQDRLVNIILENDPFAVYDDPAYEDLAEGYLDLTSGQDVYSFEEDENFADLMFVVKLLVKDSGGNFQEFHRKGTLDPEMRWSLEERPEISLIGRRFYRISGKRIILDTAPDYTSSGGIKLVFQRKPKAVTTADTTRELGIPHTFHGLIALMVAYDYARAKRMTNANDLLLEINEEKARLGLYLQSQDRDVKTALSTKRTRRRG